MFSIAKRRLWCSSLPKARSPTVPLLQVHLLEGRPAAVKAVLVEELTEVLHRVLGSDKDRIAVLLTEYAAGEWNVAGQPLVLGEAAVNE